MLKAKKKKFEKTVSDHHDKKGSVDRVQLPKYEGRAERVYQRCEEDVPVLGGQVWILRGRHHCFDRHR